MDNPKQKFKKKQKRKKDGGNALVASPQKGTANVRGQARKNGSLLVKLLLERRVQGIHPSSLAKDIPYLLPSFGKTTQYIEVRLYLTVSPITTVIGTLYNTVFGFSGSTFNNFSDFAGIFDEYRVLRGEACYFSSMHYFPGTASSALGACVAAIDYGVSAAFTTTTAAVSHDNKRFFFFVSGASQKNNPLYGCAKWPIIFEKLPDQDWLPVTTNNQNFAYWKPFMAAADSPGNTTTGFLWAWMDFQFRGMSA
jgi:hypothetical protein